MILDLPKDFTETLWFITHKFKNFSLALHYLFNSTWEARAFVCLLLPIPWTFCPVAKWKWRQWRMKVQVLGSQSLKHLPYLFLNEKEKQKQTKTKTELQFYMCFIPTLKIYCLHCYSCFCIFKVRLHYLWILFWSLKILYENLDWEHFISRHQKSTSSDL